MALARVSDASTSALEHKSLVLSAFDAFYANCNPLGAERGVGGYAKECPPAQRSADIFSGPAIDNAAYTQGHADVQGPQKMQGKAGPPPCTTSMAPAQAAGSAAPQHAASSTTTVAAMMLPAVPTATTTAADTMRKPAMRASASYRAPVKKKRMLVAGGEDDDDDSDAG
eukprot:jgi/Mesvir1/9251/Mv03119-RA.1